MAGDQVSPSGNGYQVEDIPSLVSAAYTSPMCYYAVGVRDKQTLPFTTPSSSSLDLDTGVGSPSSPCYSSEMEYVKNSVQDINKTIQGLEYKAIKFKPNTSLPNLTDNSEVGVRNDLGALCFI